MYSNWCMWVKKSYEINIIYLSEYYDYLNLLIKPFILVSIIAMIILICKTSLKTKARTSLMQE